MGSMIKRLCGRRVWSVTAMSLALFGMLFWMKLRLSVDIPKVAYAVPKEFAAEPEDTAEQFGKMGVAELAGSQTEAGTIDSSDHQETSTGSRERFDQIESRILEADRSNDAPFFNPFSEPFSEPISWLGHGSGLE